MGTSHTGGSFPARFLCIYGLSRHHSLILHRRPDTHDVRSVLSSKVLTIALIADAFPDGDEDKTLSFLRQHRLDVFPHLPAHGRLNQRRRALCLISEQVQLVLLVQWNLLPQGDTHHLVDSAPIPVCIYTRANQNKTALRLF